MPDKGTTKDKATGGAPQRVAIDADALAKLGTGIAELDTKIASASGSDAAAKKAFVEQLINQNADTVNNMVNGLMEQLASQDLAVLAGLVQRIEERMKADLVPKVEEYVNTEFPKTQTTSKDELENLRNERKTLITQFRALREVLNTFGIPNDHIEDPKASRGGRPAGSGGGGASKSGANKEGYRYFIDGKKRPKSQNSFSSVAFYSTDGIPAIIAKQAGETDETKLKNMPKKWGAGDLKKFLAEKGVNFGVSETWEVVLPNGKKVGARKVTDEDKIDLEIVEDAAQLGTSNGDGATGGYDPSQAPTDPAASPEVPAGATT